MSLLRGARLLRWLGPWTDGALAPGAIARREVEVRGASRPFRAWVWRREDEPPTGSLLLIPGLHFAGPADPRLDRFGRVLARSGLMVLAPFLPDFQRLIVGRDLVGDSDRALDALLAQPDRPPGRPGVFSISFGSLPALRLAALRGDAIGSLIVFGGFADFRRTIGFALAGDGARTNDPLNAPVVFLNLIAHLDVAPEDREVLCASWRQQCERTWGKEESKREEVYAGVARSLAHELPEHLRPLFLIGCRAAPGTEAVALAALERAGTAFDWIDPRPHLRDLRCDVHLVHGRDDDVIPHEESAALLEAMPAHVRARRHLTGLYGHTHGATLGSLAREAGAAGTEITSLFGILSAIATASRT
ncbi:MAG: alpha/beta hydrolase [Myxococcota bacterium]|nr:alpha/beta hydrolase [Myxococcota bacterium]